MLSIKSGLRILFRYGIIIISMFIPFYSISAQSLSYDIKGNIEGLEKGKELFLILSYGYNFRTIDSCNVGTSGTFEFKGTSPGPEWVLLSLNRDDHGISFILDSRKIIVNGKLINGNIQISPVDGPDNSAYFAFRHQVDPISKNINKIDNLRNKYKEDSLKMNFYKDSLHRLLIKEHKIFKGYISKKPLSFFCLEYIYSNAYSMPESFVREIYTPYTKQLKETPLGRIFYTRYILSDSLTQVGNPAPGIVQETPKGDTIKLSSYRGKWVLIDFWASWCGPCRALNPTLKMLYKKYHESGFKILGVSLDKKTRRKEWINTIKEDGITWPQISELNGWDNSARLIYGFNSIPCLFLINPQGIIIERFSYKDRNLDKIKTDISQHLEEYKRTKS